VYANSAENGELVCPVCRCPTEIKRGNSATQLPNNNTMMLLLRNILAKRVCLTCGEATEKCYEQRHNVVENVQKKSVKIFNDELREMTDCNQSSYAMRRDCGSKIEE
jgi:hypothetical protein